MKMNRCGQSTCKQWKRQRILLLNGKNLIRTAALWSPVLYLLLDLGIVFSMIGVYSINLSQSHCVVVSLLFPHFLPFFLSLSNPFVYITNSRASNCITEDAEPGFESWKQTAMGGFGSCSLGPNSCWKRL